MAKKAKQARDAQGHFISGRVDGSSTGSSGSSPSVGSSSGTYEPYSMVGNVITGGPHRPQFMKKKTPYKDAPLARGGAMANIYALGELPFYAGRTYYEYAEKNYPKVKAYMDRPYPTEEIRDYKDNPNFYDDKLKYGTKTGYILKQTLQPIARTTKYDIEKSIEKGEQRAFGKIQPFKESVISSQQFGKMKTKAEKTQRNIEYGKYRINRSIENVPIRYNNLNVDLQWGIDKRMDKIVSGKIYNTISEKTSKANKNIKESKKEAKSISNTLYDYGQEYDRIQISKKLKPSLPSIYFKEVEIKKRITKKGGK